MVLFQACLAQYGLRVAYHRTQIGGTGSYDHNPATLEVSGCGRYIDWAEGVLRK